MNETELANKKVDISSMDRVINRPWHLENASGQMFIDNTADAGGMPYYIKRARDVRRHSRSYRGFAVGVCGVIHNRYGMRRDMIHGANFKDAEGLSPIDIHGEKFIMNALKAGDTLVSLTIVAPLQPDSRSGKEDPTLHPCYKCRGEIHRAGEATAKSLVVCANPEITAIQWGTIQDYIDHHNDTAHSLGTALFDETPALFHEDGLKPGEPIVFSDELDIDTSEWDRKVTFPLAEWIRQNQYPPD